jgi:hypothetical protein
MKQAGHIVSMEKMKNAYKIVVKKPVRKRPSRRLTHTEWIILEWILRKQVSLAQDRAQ